MEIQICVNKYATDGLFEDYRDRVIQSARLQPEPVPEDRARRL